MPRPESFVNEERVDSPLENWPGYIIIPKELSAEQYARWWEVAAQQVLREKKHGTKIDPEEPAELSYWRARWHFVLDWKIEGLKSSDIEPTGLKLPSMAIANFLTAATQHLVDEAQSFPKLPAPSSADEDGN